MGHCHRRQEFAAGGRSDTGAEVFHRLCAVGLRECTPGRSEGARADRPAFAAGIPRQRSGGEHAGIREGVFMPRGATDGETGGEDLQSVVALPPGPKGSAPIIVAASARDAKVYFAASFLCSVVHIVRAVLGSTALSPSSTNWMMPCLSIIMLARRAHS